MDKTMNKISKDEIERDIQNLSIKLSEINMGNEFFVTLVSIALTIYVSGQLNMLQYWDISFRVLFGGWLITRIFRSRKIKNQNNNKNKKPLPRSIIEYEAEIFIGKNIYPGITAFGVLGALSVVIYVFVHFKGDSVEISSVLNSDTVTTMLFFGTLVLLLFKNEEYFLNFGRKLPYLGEELIQLSEESILTLVVGYIFAFIVLVGMTVGVIFGIKSFLSFSLNRKFIVVILMIFQYTSIWTLAVLINKSQIHKDLVNALNGIIDLQIQNEFSQAQYVKLLKYTNFRRGTMLKFMDYYIYFPNPKYKAWLQLQEQNSQSPAEISEEEEKAQ
ncbi:hypothetical protein [Thermococcus sp. GR6]|uniref:hypothetical protein n=1 Tax=Thermococcus sp. GR6 TaxID=1638256 RepID=UPI001430E787|nr:hypothetical protein [Thermococcus sp. GR6]NJE42094.1 hypothetical protein [Thermococcus sp. GR6]